MLLCTDQQDPCMLGNSIIGGEDWKRENLKKKEMIPMDRMIDQEASPKSNGGASKGRRK